MKHGMKYRKLNRESGNRKALLKNLSKSLLKSEKIKTTLPKAKELRPYVEKIITISKNDNLSNRRLLISIIQDIEIVNKLFNVFGKRYKDRKGGYTRIIKYGFRQGDFAPMAIIELLDEKK